MTILTRSFLLTEVVHLIGELAADWDYAGVVDENTGLFGDLGYESLDLVVLGASLQERYGKLPFSEFLADLGRCQAEDCTVGMLVQFMLERLAPVGDVAR
jgi:acyl carrier protein